MASLTTECDNAVAKLQELESGSIKSDEERSALQSEKEALVADAQAKIDVLNKRIAELKCQNESLSNDLRSSKSDLTDLLSQTEQPEANYKALEPEKEGCLKTISTLQTSIADKSQEISSLNDQLLLKHQTMAKFSFYAPPPPVVKEEAAEVPAAAVNDRVEEAVVRVLESAEGRRRRPSKWYPTPSVASTSLLPQRRHRRLNPLLMHISFDNRRSTGRAAPKSAWR